MNDKQYVTFDSDPTTPKESTALQVKLLDLQAIDAAMKEAIKQLDDARYIAFMAIKELNEH